MSRPFSPIPILLLGMMTACGGSMQVSREMKAFMEKLERTRSIGVAARAHGFDPREVPFSFYEFERAAVQQIDEQGGGTCYLLKLENEEFKRRVFVCWRNGALVSIKRKD